MFIQTILPFALLATLALADEAAVQKYFGGDDHAAYLDWYTSRGKGLFDRSLWMPSSADADQGVALHWKIHWDVDEIQLAVAARATGWVGFGLSENGGMRGADIVMFEASKPDVILDTHVLDTLVPVMDDCQSWKLAYNHTSDDGFLIFEASRRLDTGDSQDRPFLYDDNYSIQPTSVIAAWGDSESHSYHGQKRSRSSVRFTDANMADSTVDGLELFHQKMAEESEGWFFVGSHDFQVPAIETYYQIFCYNETHLKEQGVPIDQELHIVGMEPLIDEKASKYVHHFGVAASNKPVDITDKHICMEGSGGAPPDPEQTMIYTWAAGISQPVVLPTDVSYPMEFWGYGVEIHYDNIDLDEGKVDSGSGVKLYYTTKPKKYAAGVMPLADGLNKMTGLPVRSDGAAGYSKHLFSCPSECADITFTGNETITVYAERFHMHTAGVRSTNRVIRNGTVVHSSSVEFWDFDQNGGLLIQQDPFTVQPGDKFETTCYFDSPSEGYKFGGDSFQEMCVVYLYYYPRKAMFGKINSVCNYDFIIPQCMEEHESQDLSSVVELERTFGVTPDTCALPPIRDHTEYLNARAKAASEASAASTAGLSLAAVAGVAFLAILGMP